MNRLSAVISPYLPELIKCNKSNIEFLHEIFFIFPHFFLIRDHLCVSLVQSKDRVMKLYSRCNDISMNHYRSPQGKTIYIAFINNADCPNKFSSHGHSFTSKFLGKVSLSNKYPECSASSCSESLELLLRKCLNCGTCI